MPIRPISFPHNSTRKALSLVELAYALLIIGFILSFVWLAAADIYRKYDVMQADKELNSLLQGLRNMHPTGKIGKDEDLDILDVPPNMVGHFKGRSILFNPWRGSVTTFSGNAMGWGRDTSNDDFTIRFDGVPRSACTDFVMQATSGALRNQGLVAVYISPAPMEGREICLGSDSYCRNPVTSLIRTQIEGFCKGNSHLSLMFTFATH